MYRHIWGPTTTAIHAGRSFNATRAVAAPIVQSSVFEFNEAAKEGEALARWGNPNVGEVEAVLAALERADEALLTNSGTAAIALVLETFVGSSAHIVAPSHVSPGTWWLLQRWQETRNLRVSWIEHTLDLAEWEAALRPETTLVLVETPSLPTLELTDLVAIAALGKANGIKTMADNSSASPVLTRPCELGIDLSVSSAAEYLGGHSDLVAGVIAGSAVDLKRCRDLERMRGGSLDPFAAWLLHRGLKTLAVRVRRASDNAQSLAQWLLWQPQILRVDYPGLKDHPGHELAATQMSGLFGGALNFELRGGREASVRFCEALEILIWSNGFGGIESLIEHPASLCRHLPVEIRERHGITDHLLRLSVGIEDEADLKADLERGLQAATMMR